MIDAKTSEIELSIGQKTYIMKQSPGLLCSKRTEGTTGAVIWQSSFRLARWLVSPESSAVTDMLFQPRPVVLELGCGINPLLAMTMKNKVARYIATDQTYTLRLFEDNLDANGTSIAAHTLLTKRSTKNGTKSRRCQQNIEVYPLDWELDDPVRERPWCGPRGSVAGDVPHHGGVDVIVACDCVHNESMLEPFIETCKAICMLRTSDDRQSSTKCLIIQQVRSYKVLETWLCMMMRDFKLFRLHRRLQHSPLSLESGFVVLIAMLK